MEYNEELLKTLINETNLRNSNGEFKWITEWLGYLPFGQYQWIEINDKAVSTEFEWDKKDCPSQALSFEPQDIGFQPNPVNSGRNRLRYAVR